MLEGDPYVREAATIGFIETMQNNIEDHETRQRVFDLFGPEAALVEAARRGVNQGGVNIPMAVETHSMRRRIGGHSP